MEDLVGCRFGRWTVIANGMQKKVDCLCDCGTQKCVGRYDLINGKNASCGCGAKEKRKQTNMERHGVECVLRDPGVREKIKQTNLERYGAESPMQNLDVQSKFKKTNLERYGTEYPGQNKDVQLKVKQTNMERYGVEYITQSDAMKCKSRQTCLERYGVENPLQSQEVQAKVKQTNLERYGVENPLQSQEVQAKVKQTNLERYGVENVFSNADIQKDARDTRLQKYGTAVPFRCKDSVEKARKTNLERYGVEYPTQNEGVREKVKQTNLERYGVEYPTQNTEILTKSWMTRITNNPDPFHSQGEIEILEWVRQYYPDARAAAANRHQIDVLIPSLNLAIEYNGLWWHCDLCQTPRDRGYHMEKQKSLKEKGIRSIFIWENEWQDRQEQVKNLLLAAMGISTVRLGARKCEFREIDPIEAQRFVNDNHIQLLKIPPQYALGCFHEDVLVAVTTFGLHHRNGKEVVLTRFCCLPGHHISGALSKFSKMAFAHLQQPLVSWADLMKSEGTGYVAAGWRKDGVLGPDYFYIDTKHSCKIVSKQSRRKSSAKTPEGMTEAEHAKLDGLARCWDCGKIRFVFNG